VYFRVATPGSLEDFVAGSSEKRMPLNPGIDGLGVGVAPEQLVHGDLPSSANRISHTFKAFRAAFRDSQSPGFIAPSSFSINAGTSSAPLK
jgi:hypothetical protein